MALAAHRPPKRLARPRAPGLWQAVRDEKVFGGTAAEAPLPGDALDLGTSPGRLAALGVLVLVATAAWGLRAILPGAHIAIPLAASVMIPVFATGRRAELPRTAFERAAAFLRPARNALGTLVDLARVDVACIARVGPDGTADEVRLTCLPEAPIPGLRAIELALSRGDGCLPEVLVRLDAGSRALLARAAALGRLDRGRTPEEQVLRVGVPVATPAVAARVLATTLEAVCGRRATDVRSALAASLPRYRGPERRMFGGPLPAAAMC
jgi:hypothetical protein